MNLYPYRKGKVHDIYLLEVHENRDVKAFLADLAASSRAEAVPLVRRLDNTADHGITWNPSHVRALRHHAKPICEFKGIQARILWFRDKHDPRNLVCTNAFIKKQDETPPDEINIAHARMDLFYAHRTELLNEK